MYWPLHSPMILGVHVSEKRLSFSLMFTFSVMATPDLKALLHLQKTETVFKSDCQMIKSIFIALLIFLAACGGSTQLSSDDNSSGSGSSGSGSSGSGSSGSTVGTPFDGLSSYDSLDGDFLDGAYMSESVSSLPIQIFTAGFTSAQLEDIQAGLDIINDIAGQTVFELTTTWSDTVRVMYLVSSIASSPSSQGYTKFLYIYFNGNNISERVIIDFEIQLTSTFDEYLVAHELGHALGLSHNNIDYDNNQYTALESNSIMGATYVVPPQMSDFNTLIQTQVNILNNHLGETISDTSLFFEASSGH